MAVTEQAEGIMKVRGGYRVYREDSAGDDRVLPALLLGGGPGMRGDYLVPLVCGVPGVFPVATDPSMALSFSGQAQYIAELVAELGADRVWLVGHSFGARLGLAFAAAYPERTAGLILISASATPLRMPLGLLLPVLRTMRHYRRTHKGATNEEAFLATYPEVSARYYYAARTPAPIWLDIFRLAFNPTQPFWKALTSTALARADLRRSVCGIGCPVLLLHGRRDRLIPVKFANRLLKTLHLSTEGEAQLVVVPEAGHMVVMEREVACATAVHEFINSHVPYVEGHAALSSDASANKAHCVRCGVELPWEITGGTRQDFCTPCGQWVDKHQRYKHGNYRAHDVVVDGGGSAIGLSHVAPDDAG